MCRDRDFGLVFVFILDHFKLSVSFHLATYVAQSSISQLIISCDVNFCPMSLASIFTLDNHRLQMLSIDLNVKVVVLVGFYREVVKL